MAVIRGLTSLAKPDDTLSDPVRTIFHSALATLQAESGAVRLTSAVDDSLRNYITYGSFPSQPAHSSVAHWVITHREPLTLQTHEQARLIPDLVISRHERLPLICIPIQIGDTTIGALQTHFPASFEEEEMRLRQHYLKLTAELIGQSIENTNLHRKFQEMKELVQNAVSLSLEIQEKERERLILEVHDGIAQTLASAFQYLQTVDNIGGFPGAPARQFFLKALGLIRQAIQETREVINSITPATLDSLGLVVTVWQELKQFEKETGCRVNYRQNTLPPLPRHTEYAIYRIIHEAVNNVRKHANSPELEVELKQEPERLVIRVKDWGIGFIPEEARQFSSNQSIGLLSMRRRTELLGGTFKINSSLGKGTEIRVDIPWSAEGE